MSNKKNFLATVFLMAVVVWCVQGVGIPQLINYQGILLDGDGNPVTGNRSIEFLLYDVETEGTALWTETQNVTITEGLFNVLLGSVTPIPFQIFHEAFVYLTLKVESDTEMTPRKRLVSVGYAYHANRADSLCGKTSSDFIQTGQVNIVSSVDGVVNNQGNIDLVAGSNITITPDDAANSITIAAAGGTGGDDLGNHTATQNIKLEDYWLSGDGDNEGIWINNSGDVGIDNASPGEKLDVNGNIRASGNGTARGSFGANAVGVIGEHIGTGNIGHLGDGSSGAYGEYNSGNYGRLGLRHEGVYGANSVGGYSKYGYLGGEDYGAYGQSSSKIYGLLGGPTFGAYGTSAKNIFGVLGYGTDYGIYAYGTGGSCAVRAYFNSSHHVNIGTSAYGIECTGNCKIVGTLAKTAGSFRIDHPLDPANKYLQHSFVESPDMMNIYNGNVILGAAGEAAVMLPQWFDALNKDFRYQLTCLGEFAAVYIAEEISGNRFKIAGGKPGMKVSWQVTGIRHDPYAEVNRIQVEVRKEGKEAGKYQHPEVYGLPVEMRTDYEDVKREEQMHRQVLEQDRRIQEENEAMNRLDADQGD